MNPDLAADSPEDSSLVDDHSHESSIEEMEMPPPEIERTMIFDSVDIPPPPAEDSELEDSELEDSELEDSELEDSELEDSEDFGGPDDASEEQPMLVVGPSDEVKALPEAPPEDGSDEGSALAHKRDTPLRGAYEYLEIRTPIAEFESYSRARTEALVRLGDSKEAEVAALAMNLGTEALRRVMGAIPKETS